MADTAYFLYPNEKERLSNLLQMIGKKPPEWTNLDYVRFVRKANRSITIKQLKELGYLHFLTIPVIKGEVTIRIFDELNTEVVG